MTDQAKQEAEANGSGSTVDAERREALRKLAIYAAYTAPVMLAMLTSEVAVAATAA